MKRVFEAIRFYTGVVIFSILSLIMIVMGWYMINIHTDLSKAIKTQGILSSTRVANGWLLIFLKGDSTGYGVYRASRNYEPIIKIIKIDTSLTIYHHRSVNSSSYTALQIENSKGVIYSGEEYDSKERLGGYICFPGGFFLLGTIYFQIRKRRKQRKAIAIAEPN